MRITQNTPDLLIIDHVPWGLLAGLLAFMSIWVAGAVGFILEGQPGGAVVFLALGTTVPGLFVYFFVSRAQLVLDRAAGTAEIRKRNFRGTTRQPFALEQVKRAYVAGRGPHNGQMMIEVAGGMDAGHHALQPTGGTVKRLTPVVDAINAWLTTRP